VSGRLPPWALRQAFHSGSSGLGFSSTMIPSSLTIAPNKQPCTRASRSPPMSLPSWSGWRATRGDLARRHRIRASIPNANRPARAQTHCALRWRSAQARQRRYTVHNPAMKYTDCGHETPFRTPRRSKQRGASTSLRTAAAPSVRYNPLLLRLSRHHAAAWSNRHLSIMGRTTDKCLAVRRHRGDPNDIT
jgi:hypothetical protein